MLNKIIDVLEKNIYDNLHSEINKNFSFIINNINSFSIDELKKIAFLFEEASLLNYAKRIYSQILKLNKTDIDILFKLSLILIDEGEEEIAEKYLKYILKLNPNHIKAKEELEDILYKKGEKGIIKFLERNDSGEDYYYEESEEEEEYETFNFQKANDLHIQKFLQLFKSRNDVFALQWIDDNLNVGFKPIYEELNHSYVLKHFKGSLTLGMYTLRIDNNVIWAVIDIDINKSILNSLHKFDKKIIKQEIFSNIKNIYQTCSLYGFYPVIEDSGNKGYHLWFFFAEPIPAKIVRIFLKKILNEAQLIFKFTNYEIFPKQDELVGRNLGNLVKLPLGFHKKTLRPCIFVNVDGIPFSDQLSFLLKIEPSLNLQIISKIIKQSNLKILSDKDIQEVVNIESEKIDSCFENKYLLLLQEKCGIIKYLVNKLKTERLLTYEEKLCLIYSLAFLPDGKNLLRNLFAIAIDFDKSRTADFIRAVGDFPVSCAKIRKRVNPIKLSINCNCNFNLDNRAYPTPVLHLEECLGKKIVPSK